MLKSSAWVKRDAVQLSFVKNAVDHLEHGDQIDQAGSVRLNAHRMAEWRKNQALNACNAGFYSADTVAGMRPNSALANATSKATHVVTRLRVTFVSMPRIIQMLTKTGACQSIVLSWKKRLAVTYEKTKASITSTAGKTTIALRICNCVRLFTAKGSFIAVLTVGATTS